MANVDERTHRKMAADAFNETWRFLDKTIRTPDEDARMLQLAEKSRDHWAIAGQPVHWTRGEWQLSRVYSALGQPLRALEHARRCKQLAEQNLLGEFDLAIAYEAYVRAYRASGNQEEAKECFATAMTYATQVVEPEDRAVLFMDLREHARQLGVTWEEGQV